MTLLTGITNNGISRGTTMYIEFSNQLVNSIHIGKVEKIEVDNDGTTVYSLQYELTNGAKYIKGFDSESARDDEYNALKESE